MKLLTKSSLYFITVSLFVFFIGGLGFYKLFSSLLDKNVNDELRSQMHNILFEIENNKIAPSQLTLISSSNINIKEIDRLSIEHPVLQDTILFEEFKQLYLPYRKLKFQKEIAGKNYQFTIHKSLIRINDLIENVVMAMTGLLILFILGIYFLNRYLFNRIWADFFNTIDKIKKYNLNTAETMDFTDSMIDEYNQLNSVLKAMIERIQEEHIHLKEFTGNISHEIQTPLSVVKTKAELLLQTENLNPEQVNLISEIYSSTIKLTKLSQTLILLTKIEHHQYIEKEPVSFSEKIKFHLNNFQSLIDSKEITVNLKVRQDATATINPELADILTINLLKNAIRHNIVNGEIEIIIDKGVIEIANTGDELKIEPDEIFNRFTKSTTSKSSLGLGLAIVKKICDNNNIKITFQTQNHHHKFSLYFLEDTTTSH
jgi:signal transduction histidine kinase